MAMYAIAGNGTANTAEAIKTLESLWDTAVDDKGEDFWLLFPNELEPTETMKTLWAWVNRTKAYYEVVKAPGDVLHPDLSRNEAVHEVPDSYTGLIPHMTALPEDQHATLLVLGGDEMNDNTGKLAQQAITAGVPVYDLASQMVQLDFEEEETPPVTTEQETAAEQATIAEAEKEFTPEDRKTMHRPAVTDNGHEAPVAEETPAPAPEPQPAPQPHSEPTPAPQAAVTTPEPTPAPVATKTQPRVKVDDTLPPESELSEMTRAELKTIMDKALESADAEYSNILTLADRRSVASMVNALLGRPPAPKRMNKNNKNFAAGAVKATPAAKAAKAPKATPPKIANAEYFLKVVSQDGIVREYRLDDAAASTLVPA